MGDMGRIEKDHIASEAAKQLSGSGPKDNEAKASDRGGRQSDAIPRFVCGHAVYSR